MLFAVPFYFDLNYRNMMEADGDAWIGDHHVLQMMMMMVYKIMVLTCYCYFLVVQLLGGWLITCYVVVFSNF